LLFQPTPTAVSLTFLPAGLAGALFAIAAIQQQQQAPIACLRQLNPYVGAALADWRARHGMAVCLPRQPAALATAGSSQGGGGSTQLAGTSSFGMSGVNAHAVLCLPPQAAGAMIATAAASVRLLWQQQYHWPAPAPHPLLHSAAVAPLGGGSGTLDDKAVRYSFRLAAARCAFLLDHSVSGRPLLPATASFEVLLAAAVTALEPAATQQFQGSQQRGESAVPVRCGLASVAIQAPKLLPRQAQIEEAVACEVLLGSGTANVSSHPGGGTGTATPHVACSICTTIVPSARQQVQPGAARRSAALLLLVSLPTSNSLAKAADSLDGNSQKPQAAAHNVACLRTATASGGSGDCGGWLAHPAAADAALHLSAVPVPGTAVGGGGRVPVAVAAVLAAAAAAPGSSAGGSAHQHRQQQWTSSQLPVVATDGTAACSVRARLANGSCFTASSLLAKPLTGGGGGDRAAVAHAAALSAAAAAKAFEQSNFTYCIEWQAAADGTAVSAAVPQQYQRQLRASGHSSGLQMRSTSAAAAAVGAAELGGSSGGSQLAASLAAASQLSITASGTRSGPGSSGGGGGGSAGTLAAAAGGIELLQRLLAAGGTAAVHALVPLADSSGTASAAAMSVGSAGAVLAALIKVAAVEVPDRQWSTLVTDPQHCSQKYQHYTAGRTAHRKSHHSSSSSSSSRSSSVASPAATAGPDQHGWQLAAAVLRQPLLLRRAL
jgi:hypothetical protein